MLDGLGFQPIPSPESPMVLQAGRRTAIDSFLSSRVFPIELNAVLYQADLEGLEYLHNKEHTHVELNSLATDAPSDKLACISLKNKFSMSDKEKSEDESISSTDRFKFIKTFEDTLYERYQVHKQAETAKGF